jgi:hypothetical protein
MSSRWFSDVHETDADEAQAHATPSVRLDHAPWSGLPCGCNLDAVPDGSARGPWRCGAGQAEAMSTALWRSQLRVAGARPRTLWLRHVTR